MQVEKGGYKHFMLKEIHEQPQAVRDTFGGRVDFETGRVGFDALELTPDYVARSRASSSSPAAPPGTPRSSASS